MTDDPLESRDKNPFAALRQMARQAATRAEERCDLCGESIGPEHRHLLNLANREILCACRACAILFAEPAAAGGVRRLIPTRCLCLADFDMPDAQWESLGIPVNMAFFCYNSAAQRMTAFYPSPMGPTESLLPLSAWDDVAARNPILQQMEPDVEALLVNRTQDGGDTYLVPIDACYKLVGLIRIHWRGISGGTEVRKEIERFFTDLKARASVAGSAHA
jgi:hypothetical protein